MILIYCIIFSLFLFSIIILLIYVLCTGGLIKRKAAEDTTQIYDETANFEGMYWYVYLVLYKYYKTFLQFLLNFHQKLGRRLGRSSSHQMKKPKRPPQIRGKNSFPQMVLIMMMMTRPRPKHNLRSTTHTHITVSQHLFNYCNHVIIVTVLLPHIHYRYLNQLLYIIILCLW